MRMSLNLLILLIIIEACNNPAGESGWNSESYFLVWHDEFDKNFLDTTKWQTVTKNPAPYDRIPPRASCNFSGAEVFLDENVYVESGFLTIRTTNEPYCYSGIVAGTCGLVDACGFVNCDTIQIDMDYTSGNVSSTIGFNYGYFECRAKITSGTGMYPVFWLWHHDELVVFEFFGESETHYISMHNKTIYSSTNFNLVKDYSKQFHTYALEWTPFEIKWFFDGRLVHTEYKYFHEKTQKGIEAFAYQEGKSYSVNDTFPDGQDRWMGINLSVNVYEWKKPDNTTTFPAYMLVDYVRVYQKLANESVEQNLNQ